MDTFIRTVHALLLCTALAFGVIMCLAGLELQQRLKHADQLITDGNRAIVVVGGAAADLQKTLAIERAAAADQIQASNTLLKNGNTALWAITQTVNQAGGTIAALGETIHHQDETLSAIERQAGANLMDLDAAEKQITPAIANFSQASAALAEKLPPILDNVNQATAQTVTISQNVAGATGELELTAHDVRTFADRELAPVRGTWNIVKSFLVSFAGPAAQVATAAK